MQAEKANHAEFKRCVERKLRTTQNQFQKKLKNSRKRRRNTHYLFIDGARKVKQNTLKFILAVQFIFYYCTDLIGDQCDYKHLMSATTMSKKQKFTLEYPVRCSPTILYEFLSTSNGLQEWFADKVDDKENIFSFTWNGSTDQAEVVEKEQDKFIRFHWLHADEDEYFEFRIEKTEVSNQTILVITDFAEKAEVKDQSQLWDYQVKELFHRLGN
jgi:uncharacterized protein YndB with AHSA1/START domain